MKIYNKYLKIMATKGMRDETSEIIYKCMVTAFITSSIIFSIFLYSISKVISGVFFLDFIYSTIKFILLPQIVGFAVYTIKVKRLSFISRLPIYLSPLLGFGPLIFLGSILDEIGFNGIMIFTLFIAYYFLEVMMYGFIINFGIGTKKQII